MARNVEEETTVDESYSVTVPASVRSVADLDAGDRIRWSVDEDGRLSVEVVRQREGVFDDFEPAPMGGDGGTAHDRTGVER